MCRVPDRAADYLVQHYGDDWMYIPPHDEQPLTVGQLRSYHRKDVISHVELLQISSNTHSQREYSGIARRLLDQELYAAVVV